MSTVKIDTWSFPKSMVGSLGRLDLLSSQDAAELSLTARPECFDYFFRCPSQLTEHALREFIVRLMNTPRSVFYCIRHSSTNECVGMTSFLDIWPEHRRLEIGWTWLSPKVWGSGLNTDIKDLMVSYAFESLCAARLAFTADLANIRSCRAIEKAGAKQEGVLRNHGFTCRGSPRDTALYSIVRENNNVEPSE